MKMLASVALSVILALFGSFFISSACVAKSNGRTLAEEFDSWKPVQEETVETEETEDSDEIIVEDEATNEAM